MVAVLAHGLAVIRNRRFGGHVDRARWPSPRCITTRPRSLPGTCHADQVL